MENTTATCPCCSEPLLRHIRGGSIYWFCSHCWQEMPNLNQQMAEKHVAERKFLEQLKSQTLSLTKVA